MKRGKIIDKVTTGSAQNVNHDFVLRTSELKNPFKIIKLNLATMTDYKLT